MALHGQVVGVGSQPKVGVSASFNAAETRAEDGQEKTPMVSFRLHRRIPLVRRPFFEKDEAILERDALLRERAEHAAKLGNFIETSNAALPATPFAHTSVAAVGGDDDLVQRITTAYRVSIATRPCPEGSFWDDLIFDMRRNIHDALIANEFRTVQAMLRYPGETDLLYGFDIPAKSNPPLGEETYSLSIYQDLLLLSEALGARPLWYPEAPKRISPLPDVDMLLGMLDRALGFDVTFPNLFPDEFGLQTSRGIVSHRAVQSLYQAWRIFSLVERNAAARVAEIGAGTGRTAFYARQLSLRDYTIVDLPLSAVAQASFLGRAIGPDGVCLFGEDGPGIRLLPPAAFLDASDRYDIIVNVDSMTDIAGRSRRARHCSSRSTTR
jgi:hypothetical protein